MRCWNPVVCRNHKCDRSGERRNLFILRSVEYVIDCRTEAVFVWLAVRVARTDEVLSLRNRTDSQENPNKLLTLEATAKEATAKVLIIFCEDDGPSASGS